jgi:hypothetical protein
MAHHEVYNNVALFGFLKVCLFGVSVGNLGVTVFFVSLITISA